MKNPYSYSLAASFVSAFFGLTVFAMPSQAIAQENYRVNVLHQEFTSASMAFQTASRVCSGAKTVKGTLSGSGTSGYGAYSFDNPSSLLCKYEPQSLTFMTSTPKKEKITIVFGAADGTTAWDLPQWESMGERVVILKPQQTQVVIRLKEKLLPDTVLKNPSRPDMWSVAAFSYVYENEIENAGAQLCWRKPSDPQTRPPTTQLVRCWQKK